MLESKKEIRIISTPRKKRWKENWNISISRKEDIKRKLKYFYTKRRRDEKKSEIFVHLEKER